MKGFGFLLVGLVLLAEAKAESEEEPRVGVLLDISAPMGFVVPQVRKEVRIINRHLEEAGRSSLVLHEWEGASIDREGSLSVPARQNALYGFQTLFEKSEVDTVCWITSLQGMQSGAGLFVLQELLSGGEESAPPRRLVIRNAWQEQLQGGVQWVVRHPDRKSDPLDLESLPREWYRLLDKERGTVIRSWQIPPPEHRRQFGYPWRIRDSAYLRRAGFSAPVEFDFAWANQLRQRHRMHFFGPKEEWPQRITGRSWILDHSLVPYGEESPEGWDEEVLSELANRDAIEADLAAIEAEKLGVLFVFGYERSDLERFRREQGTSRQSPTSAYLEDISGFVTEARENQAAWEASTKESARVYLTEFVELDRANRELEGVDPVAAQVARLQREEGVDAVYLFTNGFVGGGRYGDFTIDLELLELAIREAGVRLYARVPFETGPAPISLQQLARASGGRVFLGKQGDADWEMSLPKARWPTDADPTP